MQSRSRELRSELIHSGADRLSDAELVSVILDDMDTSEVQSLIDSVGGLAELSRVGVSQLRKSASLGLKHSVTLAAVFELGRRGVSASSNEIEYVTSSDDVVRMFATLAASPHEEFWVVYLNSAGRVINRTRISQGGIDATCVDTRLIIKRAIELLAVSIVLVHNHPSGVTSPSDEDVALTVRIRQAAELFDIRVLDHIIVGATGSSSFLSAGLL